MDDQTPTNLLADRQWAGWGPPLGVAECITEQVIQLVARQCKESVLIVRAAMDRSDDRSRYVLTELLGITTASAVYKAVDRLLACEVAIKIHRDPERHAAEHEIYASQSSPRHGQNGVRTAAQRAVEESQTAALLYHPNIVRIIDVGKHLGWWYSAVELCDQSLNDWAAERDCWDIIDRIIEVANGLARLHEAGYAHGDIKPQNILVKKGAAKLADFGHTTIPHKRSGKARACGTLGYISPDVAQGGASMEGDTFALAVTLWVLLFGELPYPFPEGEHVTLDIAANASIQRALDHDIEEPEVIPKGMPQSVTRVLRHALHPRPDLRPTLRDFVAELQAIRDRRERRRHRRRRVPWIVAAVVVISSFSFAVGIDRGRGEGNPGPAGDGVGPSVEPADPLARAEEAAERGEGENVIAQLNRIDSRVRQMSAPELDEIIERTDRIAALLESTSPDHVVVVQGIAEYYRRLRAKANRGALRRSK